MKSKIELNIGPMYSGKSTELSRKISTFDYTDKKTFLINHNFDTREEDSVISTHSNILKNKPAIKCKSLMKLIDSDEFKIADVIGIDECQFFEDLLEFVKYIDKLDNKILIMSGLDGNFNREPFGQVLECIPYCDNIKKLKAMCMNCNDGTLASFTKRINNNKNKILIGNQESYKAVCRTCFNQN
tara:strand:- start:296 stop:850 length:555 start_codon:yes stop_codon:yes gene_type:complete